MEIIQTNIIQIITACRIKVSPVMWQQLMTVAFLMILGFPFHLQSKCISIHLLVMVLMEIVSSILILISSVLHGFIRSWLTDRVAS